MTDQPIYRLPDASPEAVLAMFVDIERRRATAIATVDVRRELWSRGRPSSLLAERLNSIANARRSEVLNA